MKLKRNTFYVTPREATEFYKLLDYVYDNYPGVNTRKITAYIDYGEDFSLTIETIAFVGVKESLMREIHFKLCEQSIYGVNLFFSHQLDEVTA